MKKGFAPALYILLALVTITLLIRTTIGKTETEEEVSYTYTNLLVDIAKGAVQKIEVDSNNAYRAAGDITAYLSEDLSHDVYVPSMESFLNYVHPYVINNKLNLETNPVRKDSVLVSMLPFILVLSLSTLSILFLLRNLPGAKLHKFGNEKLLVETKSKINFSMVAGLTEEKIEMAEIVAFLKQPEKFRAAGARIPRGCILTGPPGTGKTYLAKAVAGEADVKFFSLSGSEFVEMFVGVGAARVRSVFQQARKEAPAVVFIDEIDSVGRRRNSSTYGGSDEREQTLNQLLVEMDGFKENESVIVIAATNRPDILDSALLRPGRFDRQISVGKPDIKGREEVLRIHSKTKLFKEEVDLKDVARMTVSFTPADLEYLLNEAAILAAREERTEISNLDLKEAFIKVGIGTEKRSLLITDEEKKLTAYHEAGHAVLQYLLPKLTIPSIVSIIPVGGAGGYTLSVPEKDTAYKTKTQMSQELISLLGGRASEELFLGDVSTGASSDIERATKIAYDMVTKYGMSDVIGTLKVTSETEITENNVIRSEKLAETVDSEVRKLIQESYVKAKSVLLENEKFVDKIAAELIRVERINEEDLIRLQDECQIDA